ncbi:MAG: InlB B-repeat-containing protein [Anaeroplasma bactoclasticum]|nr:InlB B-repeat-containing protein [Anaeroplasma bactoclasticum]
MLNIRKRFFLLLTIVGLFFGFAACTPSEDAVQISFSENVYTVKVGQTIDVEPIINKGSKVEKVTVEYSSYDSTIATYVDGKLTGLQAGETVIKIVCTEKPVAYDTATVKVVENDLPVVNFGALQNSMIKGTTQTLTYSFSPEYAQAKVTFTSAHPEVATIDEQGVITAVAPGKALLVARVVNPLDESEYRDYTFNVEVIEADFAIYYELNGGTNHADNPAGYNVLTLPLEILAPTKEAYKFLGWYNNPECEGEVVTAIPAGTRGDVTLYAKWELIEFNVNYELNGGTNGANPTIYNVEKLPVTLANPEKVGYTFVGWYMGDTQVEEIALGTTGDITLTAKWELVEFNVNYELNGGTNGANPTIYDVEKLPITLVNPEERVGYTFVGWYMGDTQVEEIALGTTGDITLTAKWELISYQIEYNLNGGIFDLYLYSSREEMVDDFLNDAMAFYNKTSKPNCMVDDGGKQVGFANVFTSIYGIFSSEAYGAKWAWLKTYVIDTATDAKASLESGNETYWRYSLGAFLFKDCRTSWPKSADYTKEELANGFWNLVQKPDAVAPITSYTVVDTVVLPTPVKGNCTFLGWFIGDTKVENIAKGTTGDVLLTAKWYDPDAELPINYQLDGGALPEGTPLTFLAKDGLVAYAIPVKPGYAFKGWFTDAECTNAATPIEPNQALEGVTVYACWEMITYTIEYETNGGVFLSDSIVPEYDDFNDLVTTFLEDYGTFYAISGLTADNFYGKTSKFGPFAFFNDSTMAEKWLWLVEYIENVANESGYMGKTYLSLNSGMANFNKYARVNLAAFFGQTRLTTISPASMDFTNADNETLWQACPTKEIKVGIPAKYEYNVTELPLAIATPNKEGATFVGWYMNENLKDDQIQEITLENIGNLKLYARWSDSTIEFDTYNINYVLDGGTLSSDAPTTYVEETGVKLGVATRLGYTFVGWFTDPECTNAIEEIAADSKGDVTVYASWEAVEYTITYEVGEGKLPTITTLVSGYATIDQIVEDYLKDYNAYGGTSYTSVDELGTSAFPSAAARNFGTFYLSTVNGVKMYEKWAWLLEYLLETNGSQGAEYTRILSKYKNPETCTEIDDETYAFYYAVKGFLQASQYRAGNAYWETANYADEAVRNAALDKAPAPVYEERPVGATFTLETLPFELATPTAPEGKKFAGWYLDSEFTSDPIMAIPTGTTGNQTVYAKYVLDTEEVKYEIIYELNGGTLSDNAATEYVQGTALVLDATASKLGFNFVGWELNGEVVTEIPADTIGNVTLVAKYEVLTFIVQLVDGETTEAVYAYGQELPVLTKTGYTFIGWYKNAECTGEAVTTVTEAGTYYACWEEFIETFDHNEVEVIVDASGNGDYKTLDEAIKAVSNHTVIKLVAGNYTLGTVINKSVTIQGEGAETTIVTMAKDLGQVLAAETIIIDGITIKGAGGANNGGVYFQPSPKAHIFTIKNCVVSDMNTFIKSINDVTNPMTITIENTEITKVGQFLMWITKGVEKVNFIGNKVNAGNCGTIANSYAALFRTRVGAMYVYGNEFTGTTPSIDGIFEASVDCTGIDVKYNTFANVGKYVHINTTGKPITFDQNLYLDADGNVLTATPAAVVADGVTVDTILATSAEDVATKFENNYNVKSTIRFNLGGGAIQDNYDAYKNHDGYATMLPTVRLYDHYFLGWCLNEDLSDTPTMVLVGKQAKEVTLYAKFQQIPVNKITYVLDGGQLEDGAPTEWKEGTEVTLVGATKAESDFAGWYLNSDFSGDPVTVISASTKGNVTLYAKWANWEFKTISYELDGGTLPEGAPTRYAVTMGVQLVAPTKDGYTFLGWYDNAACLGDSITAISNTATEDITLYALWQDDSQSYNITYVLNGGNTQYATREELVAAFLADFSKTVEKDVTASNFTSTARQSQFRTFINNDEMWSKWKWLFEFIASTEKHPSAAEFYASVLNNRDNSSADFHWFLTRDFAGFINKIEGNFWFSKDPVDFTKFVNADGFWDIMEKQFIDTEAKALITPNRPYYTFLGWYDNPEFTGNPVTKPTADTTLYAKWEKETVTLTYVIGDVEATLPETEVQVHVSDSFDLVTPTYDGQWLKFNGWYKEAECVNPITTIDEYTSADMKVYASWTEIDGYTIHYVLNGGSLVYQNRAALLADFIADYNAAMGTSYALDGSDIPTGNFADINYHTFYGKSLDNGTNIRAKWLWLAEYLLELSTRDLASNNCNVLGLKALVNNGNYAGDATYGLSYAFRAFLRGTTIRPNSSYTSVDFSVYENANGFWDKLSSAENAEYLNNKGTVTLPTAYLENYKFAGWFTTPECTGDPVTEATGEVTLYAKYVEATPVESVSIDNKITELKRYETYQLAWTVLPTNANIQTVKFESSDTTVATVDNNGLITAVANGTVTIKIISLSPSGKTDEMTFEVYSPNHFDIAYETVSYVKVANSVKLLAEYIKRDGSPVELVWSSLTPEIATVNDGVVTGVSKGLAKIRVALKDNAEVYQDFVVTVLDGAISAALQEVLDAHNSNVFIRYELGIGAGKPAYYRDIVGSVSNLLYNDALVIDRQFEAVQAGISSNHGGTKSSTEFITVHYTGNMAVGSTAKANANYFSNGGGGTSIHYVTGNDGVYSSLDDKLIAYHAGDSSGPAFKWNPTGVQYDANDPQWPTWGISDDYFFTMNGKKTSIKVPYETERGYGYVKDTRFINDMGLAFTIIDGQYYMGTTWWVYSQVSEGRICSTGGNKNSIGIESCVNPESDLWYTWQKTAQLVARLLLENDLDITRVVGHHFYTAKDCPQPLLENDLEIWWIFIDMVKHEYELLTTFKDTNFVFSCDSTTIGSNGRVTEQPMFDEIVTYTVKVNGEEITLATMIEGRYNKDCNCA